MSEALADPFDSLTPEQLEALRLAREGFTSKEIARQLEISRWAVDQRIDRARARIGAGDRNEAVRMLSAWERTSERFVRDPSDVAAAAEPAMFGASYAGPSTAADNRVREMSASFGDAGISLLTPGGDAGDRGDGRSPLQTIVLILLAALAIAVLLIALPSLIQNSRDIANNIKPYSGTVNN